MKFEEALKEGFDMDAFDPSFDWSDNENMHDANAFDEKEDVYDDEDDSLFDLLLNIYF